MLYSYRKKWTVLLIPEVMKTFQKYKQVHNEQDEGGGYLFGKLFGDQVVIEVASEPQPEDKRGRHFFERDKKAGQKTLSNLWAQSKEDIFLAGEWHTHPETNPTPSPYDKKEIKKGFKHNHYPLRFMLVVIVGNGAFSDVWVGVKTTFRLRHLDVGGCQLWRSL